MLEIKVGLAQTNPVVGDYSNNAQEILHLMRQAHNASLDLVIFGELALNGYPLGDLSYRDDVIRTGETALAQVIEASKEFPTLTCVLGHAAVAESFGPDSQVSHAIAHNSATAFRAGEVIGRYDKQKLPNYDVFDDWRNFIPGNKELIFDVNGTKCAVAICEDIWSDKERGAQLAKSGVQLFIVPNGSPYVMGKSIERRTEAKHFAHGAAIAYVNLAGGQDELVFDGDSFLVDGEHEVIAAGNDAGLFFDGNNSRVDDDAKLFDVLVTGLRDYLGKTNQRKVVLGLSGGIDSALCAAIAREAIGPQNVLGVLLPSRYSSDHSIADAEKLAQNLGIEYRTVPIDPFHKEFEQHLELSDLASENIQARIRAVVLMGISNSEGHLLISTGNKSEVAVGYSTVYGDSAGGFAPIKDVYKTKVWQLAEHYNERCGSEVIPKNSITKPPSAELRPGQVDQDSLPDYQVLDSILYGLIEQNRTAAEIAESVHDPETVTRVDKMVRAAEWKRSQGAIGTKVSEIAFGRGRRVPLTTRFGTL